MTPASKALDIRISVGQDSINKRRLVPKDLRLAYRSATLVLDAVFVSLIAAVFMCMVQDDKRNNVGSDNGTASGYCFDDDLGSGNVTREMHQ